MNAGVHATSHARSKYDRANVFVAHTVRPQFLTPEEANSACD